MKSLNMVQLIGSVGSDPEVREHEGRMLSKFSIATNEIWLDKSTGEKKKKTEWHKIVCFNQLAKISKDHLKKGARIYISGRLKTNKWQDGNKENRSTIDIIAEELILLENKQSTSREGNH